VQRSSSKWVFHLMVACIFIITTLTTIMYVHTNGDISALLKLDNDAVKSLGESKNLGKFKILTLSILILCTVLLLCVYWIAGSQTGSNRLIQLAQDINSLRNGTLNKPIQVTQKGALGILEESLEKLREDIIVKISSQEKLVSGSKEEAVKSRLCSTKIVQLSLSDSFENLFTYFGDILALLEPSQSFFLFSFDRPSGTITNEPFITPHSHQELLLKKCGPNLISLAFKKTRPLLWDSLIGSFAPQTEQDLVDLDFLTKIEQTLVPKTIFPISADENLHYLLMTNLDGSARENADILENLAQLVDLLTLKINELGSRRSAVHTASTPVLNLHEFLMNARTAVHTARKTKQPLAFMFISIDFYNTIIEIYGEHTSIQVTKQMTELINTYSRKTSLLGKFNDEVFILMVQESTGSDTIDFAEQYRKLIETYPFESGDDTVRLTVSIGGSHIRHEFSENEEVLLKRARSMLDKAIEAGGNVCCFDGKMVTIE